MRILLTTVLLMMTMTTSAQQIACGMKMDLDRDIMVPDCDESLRYYNRRIKNIDHQLSDLFLRDQSGKFVSREVQEYRLKFYKTLMTNKEIQKKIMNLDSGE